MGKLDLIQIKGKISSSVFNRQRYTVTVEMDRLLSSLMLFIDDNRYGMDDLELRELFELGVPGFQRDADKWDRARQIHFIENLVSGFRPTIQLYTTEALKNEMGGHARCWILDGLQRLTAIVEFMEGRFKVFDDSIDYDGLKEARLVRQATLNVEIFTFGNDIEAAEFYIQLNRGISHSDADIVRAEDFIKIEGQQ